MVKIPDVIKISSLWKSFTSRNSNTVSMRKAGRDLLILIFIISLTPRDLHKRLQWSTASLQCVFMQLLKVIFPAIFQPGDNVLIKPLSVSDLRIIKFQQRDFYQLPREQSCVDADIWSRPDTGASAESTRPSRMKSCCPWAFNNRITNIYEDCKAWIYREVKNKPAPLSYENFLRNNSFGCYNIDGHAGDLHTRLAV